MTNNKPKKEIDEQAEKEKALKQFERYYQRKEEEIEEIEKAQRKINREKGIITSLAYIGGMGIIIGLIIWLSRLGVPHFILLLLLFIMIGLLFGGVSILISKHIYRDDRL